MAEQWSAVLARLGTPTGDGRILSPGGITNRDLPMPLMWQEKTAEGHSGAVTVGSIETIEYSSDMVTATGTFLNLFPDRERVFELIRAGVVGPSVDLADDVEFMIDDNDRAIITQAGIGGVTLVPIEAFSEVSIHMTSSDVVVVAAVRSSGWADMPIADAARAWDSGAARNRIDEWADDDISKYARAFLHIDDSGDRANKGTYGFPIADVIDGQLMIVPRAVFAAAAVLEGSRGGTNVSEADQNRMKSVLTSIYKRLDREAPFSSMAASAAPALPPLAWFTNPGFGELTPITITDDGRVFGHIAPWGTCHVGMPGCVTAPFSQTEYAYFLVGGEKTSDGVTVPVGKLTVGGGHADPNAGFVAAAEHYDAVGTAVASVFAGEDDFGIWVAGRIIPGVSHDAVAALQRSPISGDWRRIGGNLELVAAHAVNVPGFPVPRAKVKFASGDQVSLVASFSYQPEPDTINDNTAAAAKARWSWKQKGR